MFVTNRRVKLSKEITVDSKNVNNKLIEIKVNVVTSFKLLGVTIDKKLTFTEHCSNIKKIGNWKTYSIKRLFYLCTSVKIQFFKTFILPDFDYCLSLIIYFPSTAYQILYNCFNLCLYKLFNFFKEFFPKLIKTFRNFSFPLERDPFRLQVNLNLNENLKTFLTSFPKFDIKFPTIHRKK